jgi:hypothetical protein
MCIIVMIPVKAARVGEDIINKCWSSNPDGAGLMYPDKVRKILVVDKGHMTLSEFQAAYAKVPVGVPVCLHFRIKTHGLKDPANTHPHVVHPDEVAIVHNGVLPIGAPTDSPESDTARFARLILAVLPKRWFKNPALVHLIEEYMGKGNKIVAMDAGGDFKIINEEAGTWEQGVWFSNSTFRSYRSYGTSYGGYGYDSDDGGWVGAHQAGAAYSAQVAAARSPHGGAGSVVQPQVPASTSSHPEDQTKTQLLDAINDLEDKTDPLIVAMANGKISGEDQALLYKDIGSMSDAEFHQYEEIMNGVYGGVS